MTDFARIVAFPSMPPAVFQLLIHGDLVRELPDFMERFAASYGDFSSWSQDARVEYAWECVLAFYDMAVREKTP